MRTSGGGARKRRASITERSPQDVRQPLNFKHGRTRYPEAAAQTQAGDGIRRSERGNTPATDSGKAGAATTAGAERRRSTGIRHERCARNSGGNTGNATPRTNAGATHRDARDTACRAACARARKAAHDDDIRSTTRYFDCRSAANDRDVAANR
jgi:hypothetical protein